MQKNKDKIGNMKNQSIFQWGTLGRLKFCEKALRNKRIFSVLLLLGVLFSIRGAENELVLYEAGQENKYGFQCDTCAWIKESNAKPVTSIVERDGGKWLQFKTEGDKGSGRAVIYLKNTISSLVPENMVARGVEITIDYPGKDFKKLVVNLNFNEGKCFSHHLSLEEGVKAYYVDRGYTRTGIPETWDGLNSFVFFISAGFPEFYLKKIAIKLHPKQVTEKQLEILRVRKVAEVLPGKDTAILDFGEKSPFQVKIGYDQNNLYVNSEAEFPSMPRTSFKSGDKVGEVWADELSEYFFSAWNDNRKYIQFVTNMNGAVWDSITDFDQTAAMVIRKTDDWQLKHDKKISWGNNAWKTEAAFPFADLKFDSSKQRFMGFQIAQGYEKERGEKYTAKVWDNCTRFPEPSNFGVLVFNRKAFGQGTITPQKISAITDQNSEKVDFLLKLSLADFSSGKYKLHKYVAIASDSFVELPVEEVDLNGENQILEVNYKKCVNLNGKYSLYAALENVNGDMRLTAVNFDNSKPLVSMFGEPVFCPAPKQIFWKEGVFNAGKNNVLSVAANASERTQKTAKIFAEKLLGYAGKYHVEKENETGILLRVASSVDFNGKNEKLKPEAYCLKISPDKVTITGADEAGLYYGCITFMQMLRQPMKRLNDAPVRCAEILDYPDLKKRFTNLLHPWQFLGSAFKERRDINYLIEWVDKYVAGTKQNMFIADLSSLVTYKRHPEFNAAQCLYSLDDLKKLAQYCRDNFIEFIPRWQTGGHASWWLLLVHPELREKGYGHTADVTHPEHNKIVFDCMLDVIEATQCKYIQIGGDEWWHTLNPKEKPDELLHGKTRAQAFVDFHKEVMAFAKKNSVEVMMHEDMLDPYHNGVRYDLYKIIDEMPKDIIILPWSGGNVDRMIMYFVDKGFRVWPNPTGIWFLNRSLKHIGGFGNSVYSFSWALHLGAAAEASYAQNILRGAEYAWNAYSDSGKSLTESVSSGLIPALIEQFAEPWNPLASQTVVPINISKAFNTDFNKLLLKREPQKYAGKAECVELPTGEMNVGNIPMQLGNGNLNCIRIGQKDNVSLPINAKYSSLIFLHTVRTDEQFLKDNSKKLSWRYWIYGRPAGDYIVKYADGSNAIIPLRLDDNINFAGIKPLLRSCINCRYILPLKDSIGNYLFLYQYEWINPHPEKEIQSVELTQTIVDFDLLLFALSGREVK